jgi:hypothetical protein
MTISQAKWGLRRRLESPWPMHLLAKILFARWDESLALLLVGSAACPKRINRYQNGVSGVCLIYPEERTKRYIPPVWYNKRMKNIIQFMVTKEQGAYTADGVNVPIVTEGSTFEELQANIREAVALYFEDENAASPAISLAPCGLAPGPASPSAWGSAFAMMRDGRS